MWLWFNIAWGISGLGDLCLLMILSPERKFFLAELTLCRNQTDVLLLLIFPLYFFFLWVFGVGEGDEDVVSQIYRSMYLIPHQCN